MRFAIMVLLVCNSGLAFARGPKVEPPADPALTAMQDAVKAYKKGRAIEARAKLEDASQLIEAQLADRLAAFLPEALPEWTITPAEAGETAPKGRGLNAARSYMHQKDTVTVSITGDAPVLTALGQTLSEAGQAKPEGTHLIDLKNHQAVVTEDGQVLVLVGGRFAVIIEGSASEAVKTDYLKAIDLDRLAAF